MGCSPRADADAAGEAADVVGRADAVAGIVQAHARELEPRDAGDGAGAARLEVDAPSQADLSRISLERTTM